MAYMDWLRRHIRVTSTGRLVALLLWLLFIWGNSCVSGDASSSESLAFLEIIRPVFEALGITDTHLMHTLVRKCAHFLEYLVLAVLAVRALGASSVVVIVAFGLLAPCVDETIQLFVPGRVGAITDVCIDACGFATGALACRLLSGRPDRSS